MRVSLSGSYSTGKTTLAKACLAPLRARYGPDFSYIEEVARTVIARGFGLDRAATIDSYVVYIQLQLEAEREADTPHVLSDRSLIDLLAYIRYNDEASVPKYVTEMLEEVVWLESRYFDVYCHLPIEFPLQDDGVRTVDEQYRAAIDDTLVSVFERYGVTVRTVTGSPDERRATLLGLFGVTPG